MYAFQQAGMTIATKVVGMLKDTTGWLGLQMFFTILQLVGLGLSIYLITRIGLHSTKTIKPDPVEPTEEEIELKNDNE
jgi:sugar phosphate permease